MKKILKLFLFILIFCCFTNVMFAKTIEDVECNYKVVSYAGDGSFFTDIKIRIVGYKDGKGGSVEAYYQNPKKDFVKYTGATTDWYNYGNTSLDSGYNDALNMDDIVESNSAFLSTYKNAKSCPTILVSKNYSDVTDRMFIETYLSNPDYASLELKPTSEKYKDESGNWVSKNDFYKDEDTGQTTVKDDLVCTYTMFFDKYNMSADVEFTTKYDPSDSSKKTYRVSVNGAGYNYTTLDEDISLMIRQGGSEMVHVSSAELKKIFKDECLPGEKVYHYYNMSREGYIITTDEQEAANNGAGGRYDNGDGSNDGTGGSVSTGPSVPDISIIDKPMTCEEILGEGAKLIKLGVNVLRIAGVIIALINGMMAFIPAVSSGDKGQLNAAFKKCINMAIILILIVLIPELINVIGNLFGWDTSCIF